MSSERTKRSLTIRTPIPTVTRDQEDTSKKLLTLSHIGDFYPQATWIHVYTDGSATDAVQDGGAGSMIYLPNGKTLEAASATGKYCTNHYVPVEQKIRQQNTYCKDVQHTNISDNRHYQTEHHYIRSCMGKRSTREDSWLHSAGWLIRVIKRTRRRRRRRRLMKVIHITHKISWHNNR